MAIEVKDGNGNVRYLKSTGAGGTADPYVPEHTLGGTASVSVVGTVPVSGAVTTTGTVSANVVGTVPVSGTMGVSGTVPVSGAVTATGTVSANIVGTVPVSGAVTTTGTVSTNVVGTIPVSGNVGVSGTVSISGAPVTLTTTRGTVTSGVGTAIANGAGTIIVVHDLQLQFIAGTAATRCYAQAGTVPFRDVYMGTAGDGLVFAPPLGKEIRLTSGQPLTFDNTGGTVAYTVRTTTEAG